MIEHDDLRLAAALRDLGTHLAVPEPPDVDELTESVLARLDEPAPRPSRHGVLLKVAAVVVVVLLALGVLITVSPPVRAAVLNLLRFAGIELSTDSAPTRLPVTPAPLPDERSVDLPTAERLSAFRVVGATSLGQPEQVLLIDGTPPRVVSLLYQGGTVRLDEFDGTLDLAMYKKQVRDIQFVTVNGESGVWVNKPHVVTYIDRDGKYRDESARLTGKTLIWQHDNVTLRLEGDFTFEEALAIARSVR